MFLKPISSYRRLRQRSFAPLLCGIVDQGGSMVDATESRIPLVKNSGVQLTPSPRGPAFLLDGSTGYVQTSLTPGPWQAITVACSMRLDAAGFYPMLMSYGTNSDPGGGVLSIPELRCNASTGHVEWACRSTNTGVTDTVNRLGTGWHRVVATAAPGITNQSYMALWVDGVLIGTTTTQQVGLAGSQPFRFGQRGDGGFFFQGAIDDCRVYNRLWTTYDVLIDLVDRWWPLRREVARPAYLPLSLVGNDVQNLWNVRRFLKTGVMAPWSDRQVVSERDLELLWNDRVRFGVSKASFWDLFVNPNRLIGFNLPVALQFSQTLSI